MSFGIPHYTPDYRVASQATHPAALNGARGLSNRDAFLSQAGTGLADPSAPSIYEAYYGPAPPGIQGIDVMGHIARTNLTLPAYYHGKNMYLERIICGSIADLDDYLTVVFLKIVPYDGMKFSFAKMQATPHILDRVPEEAASRLVTTEFELEEASTERYGLAFRMEHGLMGTPLGEKMWNMNIKQIVDATARSIQMAIMNLAVCQQTYFAALAEGRLREQTGSNKIRQIIDAQTQLFGCFQKRYGVEISIGNMLSIFKDRGIQPDMAIVPADVPGLLRCRSEHRDFMIDGALAQMYNMEPRKSLKCYVHNETINMFEHRGYCIDRQGTRESILTREREIGEYFIMKYDPAQRMIPGLPGQRDIFVIDHNKRRIVRLKFEDALRCSGYFDNAGHITHLGAKHIGARTMGDLMARSGSKPQPAKRSTSKQARSSAKARKGAIGAKMAVIGVFNASDHKAFFDDLKLTDFFYESNGLPKSGAPSVVMKTMVKILGDNNPNTVEDWIALTKTALKKQPKNVGFLDTINDRNILSQTIGGGGGAPQPGTPKKDPPKETPQNVQNTASVQYSDHEQCRKYGEGDYITIDEIMALVNDGTNVNISLYVLRPNMIFRMAAAVLAKGGMDTGFTVFGNANFELSDEATTKTALGHFTCYFKPIIAMPENVMVLPDAVFQGYVSGGGTKFVTGEKAYNPQKKGGEAMKKEDLVAVMTTQDDSMDGVIPLVHSGDENETAGALWEMASNFPEAAKEHIDTLLEHRYQGVHLSNKGVMEGIGNVDRYEYKDRYRGHNIMCFQGRQWCFQPTSEHTGEYTREIRGRGHLAGVDFEDSASREFTGNMSFRNEPNLMVAPRQ